MFFYVSFSLGQYQVSSNNLWSLFINSKFLLGTAGIFFVALSVARFAFCELKGFFASTHIWF